MAKAGMLLPELPQIHERFLWLSRLARERFADSLGGKLLLRCGLDAEGIAAAIAASIAGAASLCVDADADRLRDGLRAGFVDFAVGNSDEALRILKNEIRRGRAIAVGLTADPHACMDAMMERGLQPDLLSAVPERAAGGFREHGAVAVPAQDFPDAGTSLVAWSMDDDPSRSMARIAPMAAASLDPARSDTPSRQRWLDRSPRYLGRAFATRQCLRMTEEEIAVFLPQARAAFPSAKIRRDGHGV